MNASNKEMEASAPSVDELARIDRVCLEFEDRWRRGDQPSIESFLAGIDIDLAGSLLRELLALELFYLVAAGAAPDIDEYKSRFPAHVEIVDQVFFNTARRGPSTDDERTSRAPHAHAFRCPQCRAVLSGSLARAADDVECPDCGCAFSVLPDETADAALEMPRQVGRFTLVKTIGNGQFGTVWLAHDAALDRAVAIKVPRKEQLSPEETEQFLREARAAAQLRHPNIVSIHEVGRDNDTAYIVSDYIEGPTLADSISAGRPSFREAALLCRTLAEALHHAHEAGVVHRDIKPSNILMGRARGSAANGDDALVPYIADFGLAKRDAGEMSVTMAGRVLGTPAYMPPEQARGEGHRADRRSDLYSLGVILFQLLSGELPFRGNVRMLLWQILHDEPPSPRKFQAEVPRDLETIALKCLEKQPGKRYQTARELADDLERHLRGEPIHARPVSRGERARRWCRRNPRIAALSASLCLAIVLGFAGVYWQWRRAVAKAVEAEQGFQQANQAVNDYLSIVSESQLLNVPGLQPLRRELMEKALAYNVAFAKRRPTDFATRAQAARAHNNISRIQFDLGNRAEAQRALEEGVERWEELREEEPQSTEALYGLGTALQELSVCHKTAGNFDRSHELLNRARTLLEELWGLPKDALDTRSRQYGGQNLALVYHDLAMLELRAGRPQDARQIIDRGLELIDALLQETPNDSEKLKFAVTLHANSSTLYRAAGDDAKTRAELETAVMLAERLVRAQSKSFEARELLGAVTCDLANACFDAGELEKGTELHQSSVRAFAALAAENPQVPHFRELQAGALINLSVQLQRRSRGNESLALDREAVNIMQTTVAEFPDNVNFRSTLIRAQAQLAVSQRLLGNAAAAIQSLNNVIAEEEALAKAEPASLSRVHELCTMLVNRAELYRADHHVDAALADLRRAHDLLQPQLALHPENPRIQTTLARINADLSALEAPSAQGRKSPEL